MSSATTLEFTYSYPITELNPDGSPLPTQQRFHQSKKKYRLLAGGFGTGKTTALVLDMLQEAVTYSNNYILLGRKDLMELTSTTLKEFLDVCPEKIIREHNKKDRVIRLLNNTEIFYTNLDENIGASEKIKSLNLGAAYIDQLEEISETVFLAIQGRLRRYNTSRCFAATCNPAGHDWLFRRWKKNTFEYYCSDLNVSITTVKQIVKHINKEIQSRKVRTVTEAVKKFYADYNPDLLKNAYDSYSYELFEAITLENTYLPEDYIQQLLSYPERWVKRFVYCSWDDFEGTVFDEFKETLHTETIYQPKESDEHYIVLDYGFRNPCAILFISVDFDGMAHIYDEYYETEQLIPEIATAIKKNKYWHKATKLIDPSTFNTQRDSKSIADEFNEYGVNFLPANNNVQQGIDRVNQHFKADKIRVSKKCQNFLVEIGDYKWKTIDPSQARNEYEEPIKKNDHLMDALRYFINYIHVPAKPSEQPQHTDYNRRHNKKLNENISIEGI